MKRAFAPLACLLAVLLAAEAVAFTLWDDLRASALLPGDEVTVRVEGPQGAGQVHSILHFTGGIQEQTLTGVPDGPGTLEATVPGPVATRRYYGFRLVQGDAIDLLTVRVATGPTPDPLDLTFLTDDPTGDEAFGRPHLDLVACRLGRDDTRLYAALTNDGGGFPVSQGLTFFSYLLGIKNPASAVADTVFGMIQTVDVAGIIAPGLYQINGDGINDLVKIGEITATEWPAANTLVLSCLLADLEANPVFQSWYDDADPRLEPAGFTQRITLLGGAAQADSTQGGVWHLREVALDPGPNSLPELSGEDVSYPAPGSRASVVYTDAEGHCPVTAELVFDGMDSYALRPVTLDYGSPVEYRSDPDLPPLVSGSWSTASFRFSDNGTDVVTREITVSAVGDDPRSTVRAAPNPFSASTRVAFELGAAQPVSLVVYDLAGRRVRTMVAATLAAGPHATGWDGRDGAGRPQPAGVYFYRLRSREHDTVQRVTLLR